ncbi:MAG TPA: hypothetical protein VK961_05965 [Chthoniobacter sp.]|nr:hypothetical protein [Chthoniobacter sp.]
MAILTLVALGVAGGVAWRVELERRFGWDALAWTSGFFWTVPVVVALFIAWAACFASVHNRAGFVGALMAFFLPGYLGANIALHAVFGRFASTFSFSFALVIWLLIPLSFCLLCRLLGAPITAVKTICSTLLFVLSWPISTFVRDFFEERGSDDFIHALKSGFIVPFLIVSLGLPLLPYPARTFRRKAASIGGCEAGQAS